MPSFTNEELEKDHNMTSTPFDAPAPEEPEAQMKIRSIHVPEMVTLRDQFAMAALTGLLADGAACGIPTRAKAAWTYADAMLTQRNQRNEVD